MSKVLVTGANGLLGQKLVTLLSADKTTQVIATGRGPNRSPALGISYHSLDLSSQKDVEALVDQVNPDAIIHTAAMTQVDDCEQQRQECWQANVLATEYLLRAAEKLKSFFLHISTDFIFDGTSGPYKEDDTPNPISYYGESKLAAEQLVMQSSLDSAIARTVLVYGVTPEMSRSNIVLWVKKSLEEGRTIKVVNDQWRTPTLAEDLAMGCALIVRQKATGIYHISGAEMMTPYDLALRTASFFGLDTRLITIADATTFTQPAKRPPRTGFIIEKAQKVLGYQPRSFEEGLAIVKEQLKS